MTLAYKKEIGIGLSVLIALLCLFFIVNYLKGVNIFHSSNYYYSTYTDVKGLAVSAPVTLNGFKVGQVKNIKYDYSNPGHVNVELSLTSDLKIPEGSEAELSIDLLGTTSVVLHLTDSKEYLKVGSELAGVVSSGMTERLSQEVIPQVGPILQKIDSLLTGMNSLVSDPAVINTISRMDEISKNLNLAMINLTRASRSLPKVMENVDSTTAHIAVLSANIAEFSEGLNKLPLDSTMRNVNRISENLRVLSDELNNPNSTLGLLINDPQLYKSLNKTVNGLDSLFIDIKKNPKRYINIKLL